MICVSSLALEQINIWRNPQGREENWSYQIRYKSLFNPRGDKSAKYREVQLIKAVVGQCVSFGILAIALIETVAYTSLTTVSLVFSTYNDTLYKVSRELLSSSFFTILWIFSKSQLDCSQPNFREQKVLPIIINTIKAISCFFLGRVFQNEPTHEAFARKKYRPDWFFRSKDREAMIHKIDSNLSKEWIQNYIADENNLDFLRNVENDPILLKDLLLQQNFLEAQQELHDNREEKDKIVYECAISFDLLTEDTAVQDPTTLHGENPTFYNQQSIINWLRKTPLSPVTRLPLHYTDLIDFEQMKPTYQEGIRRAQRKRYR